MSTRAIYSFDNYDGLVIHVYKYRDGYPTGAAKALLAALPYALSRSYESDDFAAAFVCANKLPKGGGVRIIPQGLQPHEFARDAEYRYHISPPQDGDNGQPTVTAFSSSYWEGSDTERFLFRARLDKFAAAAKKFEKRSRINHPSK